MTGADVRQVAHLTTIPINVLLVAWVAVGRTAFLPDGTTDGVRLTGTVLAPLLMVLLGVTSALTIAGSRPEGLSAGQFGALAGIWAALAGFGFFLLDNNPATGRAGSPFTEIAGSTLAPLSDAMTLACIHGFVAAYIALLLQLVCARRGAERTARAGVGIE